jgi:hypothetical protein
VAWSWSATLGASNLHWEDEEVEHGFVQNVVSAQYEARYTPGAAAHAAHIPPGPGCGANGRQLAPFYQRPSRLGVEAELSDSPMFVVRLYREIAPSRGRAPQLGTLHRVTINGRWAVWYVARRRSWQPSRMVFLYHWLIDIDRSWQLARMDGDSLDDPRVDSNLQARGGQTLTQGNHRGPYTPVLSGPLANELLRAP